MLGADRAVPGQGLRPRLAGHMAAVRVIRRAAGDIRPCPSRGRGVILQARSEVSWQEHLTAPRPGRGADN